MLQCTIRAGNPKNMMPPSSVAESVKLRKASLYLVAYRLWPQDSGLKGRLPSSRARLELRRMIEVSIPEKAADSAALLARLDESVFISIKGE